MLVGACAIGAAYQIGGYMKVILLEGTGKNGSTVAVRFSMLFVVHTVISGQCAVDSGS